VEADVRVGVEEIAVALRIHLLGDRRRADQVAEEDGHLLPLALDPAARREDLLGEPRGHLLAEARKRARQRDAALGDPRAATPGAEAEARPEALAALLAALLRRRIAARAMAGIGSDLGTTTEADHVRRAGHLLPFYLASGATSRAKASICSTVSSTDRLRKRTPMC